MPNPNSPELTAQRKQVQAEIEALEQEIENAPDGTDTSAQEQQLEEKHDELRDVQKQQQAYRADNRQTGRDKQRGGGRDQPQ